MKEELGYVYQRADGTVERALSAEDAFARCPVLGRLAMDEAQLFLELASAGNEKMKTIDEAQTQHESDEEADGVQDDELGKPIGSSSVATFELVTNDTTARPEMKHSSFAVASDTLIVNDQHSSPNKPEVGLNAKEKNVIKPAPEISQTEVVTENKIARQKINRMKNVVQSQPVIIPSKSATPDTKVEPQLSPGGIAEVASPEKKSIERATVDDEVHVIDVTPKEAAMPPSNADDILPLSVATDREPESLVLPKQVDAEFDVAEQTRQLFDIETIETYQTLREFIDVETLEGDSSLIESTDPLESDESLESVHRFEAFISAQPASEKQMGLEGIQNQANEQALEQTFHQLVEYLSVTEELEEVESNDLLEIMYAIEEVLATCDLAQSVDVLKEKEKITPEMTEKLLTLLETLGYQNPSEVLVTFVDMHGLTFLIEALEYIYQMNSDDRALLISGVSTARDENDDSRRLRLGKILFGFIAKITPETVT